MFALSKKRMLVNDSLKLCFYRKPIEKVESISFLGITLYETLPGNITFLHCYKKLGAGILFKPKSYLNSNNLINIFHSLAVSTALRLGITEMKHLFKILKTYASRFKKYHQQ